MLSPLGLLAEASLQNTDPSKKHSSFRNGTSAPIRPSPLSLGGRNGGLNQRVATSDIRGGGEDGLPDFGVASTNYFKPGAVAFTPGAGADDRVPELLTILSREEIEELFGIFFKHSEYGARGEG